MSAYTIERLNRVVDAFANPGPQKKKEPTFEDVFGCPSVYDFRPRVNNGYSRLAVPCMDDDDTEDYDPNDEWSPRKRRPNVTSLGSPRPSRTPKKARSPTKDIGALQRELLDDSLIQSEIPSNLAGYNFRPRPRPHVSSERVIESSVNTAATEINDLTPNPLLSPKECLACLELSLDCSLEHDPLSYPCSNCRDDNLDCVVHPPPAWKRTCENCRSRHRSQCCSYSYYDYDHSKPCQFCHDRGFDCVAGPAKYQPSLLRTDGRDTDEFLSHQGTNISSKPDAVDGSVFSSFIDSYENTGLTPAYRLTTTVEAAAIDSPKLPNPLQNPMEEERFISGDFVNPEPFILKNDVASLAGETDRSSLVELGEIDLGLGNYYTSLSGEKTPLPAPASIDHPKSDFMNELKPRLVRTELPHPLKANYDPSPAGEKEGQTCHWCDNFAYGISGLGVRYPEVIETSAGEWFELRDGHTHEGRDPSRMCIQCTFKRVSILLCSHDTIIPLENSENVDVDAAYDELDKASKALHPAFIIADGKYNESLHAWCSLCRAPAFWRCDECHPIIRDGTFTTIPIDPGCGLHLCDYCASLAMELYGDLEAVVAHGLRDPVNETDYRADVEYILKHSGNNVLWQQLRGTV